MPLVGKSRSPARKIQIYETTRGYFYYIQNGRKVAQNDQRSILGFRLFQGVGSRLHPNVGRPDRASPIPAGSEVS